MGLPPCACPDPHGPGGCTCALSRQWVGYSHAGPSALFENSSCSTAAGPLPIPLTQIPLTTLHHAPHKSHESHASHDSHNFHSMHALPSSNIQNIIFPHIPYNNALLLIYPKSPIPLLSPSASRCACHPSSNSSPSKSRKRKSNAAG
jgi:hypothetical protein